MNETKTKIYKARYSIWGYISLSLIIAFLIFIIGKVIIGIDFNIKEIGIIGSIILYSLIVLTIFSIFFFLILLFTYHTLRYEFREDGLYLIYGPFKEKIDYKDILKFEKRDLEFNPLSSLRMPGLVLFNVIYSDEGKVRMYATTAGSNVLLIYTKKRKYGITPQNEESFILELEKRVEGNLKYFI